ncbi:MAG: NAD(+) synthase [bacterium]|nr:NAD(+) synthase [bacterium]
MMNFNKDILHIDCAAAVDRISRFIREQTDRLKRDGAVVGLSGGIDSALAAALSVHALGKDNVLGLILPEKESSPVSAQYAEKHARQLGIRWETMDITATLEAFGTYEKRDAVVRSIFPGYDRQCKIKIALPPDLLDRDTFNVFTLIMSDGKGNIKKKRLNKETLKGIVAATNTKQRTRMMALQYYAEKLNYLQCGTTNKSETVQGFFVRYGDGGVDIEPLAHLYKIQGYRLAEYLDIIEEIRLRAPSPDTYPFPVTDEEFYFRIPMDKLDLLLFAWENKIDTMDVCRVMDLKEEQVKRAFRDFTSKFNATEHLRELPPMIF